MRKYILLAILSMSAFVSLQADSLNSLLYRANRGSSDAMNQLGVIYYTGNGTDRDFDAAQYWWSRGALKGNPKAIANLGVCYQYGRGARRDSVEAMRLYIAAIAAGQTELLEQRAKNVATNPFDAMLAATCHFKGIGTPADPVKAIEYYVAAADKGSADGMRGAGEAYLELGDKSKAIEYFVKGAEAGDPQSAYLAGSNLVKRNSQTDRARGFSYLRKAADAGNPMAQDELGHALYTGTGIRQDMSEGLSLMRESALNGSGQGMWDYAGALLDTDYDAALFWFAEAARAGYMEDFKRFVNALDGSSDFRNYLEGMREYLVNGNYDRAEAFFKKVEKHRKDGALMRAIVVADEDNPSGNPKKAAKWLRKLTTSHPKAAVVLSEMYLTGRGVKKSYKKALSTLRTASNSGYGPAQDALASLYLSEDGNGDSRQIVELYQKAEASRALSAQGKENLMQIYNRKYPVSPIDYNSLVDYVPYDGHVKDLLSDNVK